MSMQIEAEDPRPASYERVVAFFHTLTAGVLAGIVAGVIAGGIGGRIAMRISAIAAGDELQGAITEAEQIVGEITVSGTIALMIFGGALIGGLGGLFYLAVRPWLQDTGRWQGLAFGVLLFAVFGWAIVEGDNPDFHRFGPPALNIAMFAAIFVAFGVLIAPAFSWLQQALPQLLSQRSPGPFLTSVAAHGLALLFTVGILAGTVSGFGEEGDNARFFTIVPLYVVLGLPAASLLLTRMAGRFERLSDLGGKWAALGLALAMLAAAVILGLVLDVRAIVDIYEADKTAPPRFH